MEEIRNKVIEFGIVGLPYGKKNMKPVNRGKYLGLVNPSENETYMGWVRYYYNDWLRAYCYPTNEIYFRKNEPLRLEIRAYYQIPKSCYNTKGELNKKGGLMKLNWVRPTKKPDCDNISKVICDALNKMCFSDDSQIVELVVKKFYSENPHVEVKITNLEDERLCESDY